MTIAVAWTRNIRNCEELMFASDSRLSGDGDLMDYCPKIIALPRGDCAICFAGYTGNAFAMMTQLEYAINAHEPLKRRSMDIRKLRTHALKIFDSMASAIKTDYVELKNPSCDFIFGGYSWINKKFDIWNIKFNVQTKIFEAVDSLYAITHPKAKKIFWGTEDSINKNQNTNLGMVTFCGDQGDEARTRFEKLMLNRFKENPKLLEKCKLDMEPFTVVRDMLRDKSKSHTIGGAPQVVKIYQYMSSNAVPVYWPNKKSGQITLLGRPILGYENLDSWVLDPDKLQTSNPRYGKKSEEELEDLL